MFGNISSTLKHDSTFQATKYVNTFLYFPNSCRSNLNAAKIRFTSRQCTMICYLIYVTLHPCQYKDITQVAPCQPQVVVQIGDIQKALEPLWRVKSEGPKAKPFELYIREFIVLWRQLRGNFSWDLNTEIAHDLRVFCFQRGCINLLHDGPNSREVSLPNDGVRSRVL